MSAHHPTTTDGPRTSSRPSRQAEGSVLGVAQAGVVVALLALAAGGKLEASAAAAHAEHARRLAAKADPYLVTALGGEVGHAAFRQPARVRAWRIGARPEAAEPRPEGEEVETLHGYAVLAGPVDVTGARARAFADALGGVSFSRESSKRCAFAPGVVVRWEDEVHAVDVLLCFSCQDLLVRLDGEDATPSPARGSHVLHDFTPQRAALLAAAQAAFPHDEALAGLTSPR